MKIAILGSKGMLGSMVLSYFRQTEVHEVVAFDRRFVATEHQNDFFSALNQLNPNVVINCIGMIKQRNPSLKELFQINAIFPGLLAKALSKDTLLIHPSTDCVFAGNRTRPYEKDEISDAADDYGISKAVAEVALALRPNTTIVRTSIIGPDASGTGLGLMEWFFRQQRGTAVQGYTNHAWNGITTFEWCRFVEKWIDGMQWQNRSTLIQIGSNEPVSKYELLCLINEIFERGIGVSPHDAQPSVNRVLNPEVRLGSIKQQLLDLRKRLEV